jgi:proteic killer suppression protein
MIKGFADAATREIFAGCAPRGLPHHILPAARRKLRYLDAAVRLADLQSPPGNKLHPLHHDRAGQHAIWINDQYRICFRWRDDGVYDVQITDYH